MLLKKLQTVANLVSFATVFLQVVIIPCYGNFRIGRELQQANVVLYCQTMYRRQFLFFFTQYVSHPLFLTELIDNEG